MCLRPSESSFLHYNSLCHSIKYLNFSFNVTVKISDNQNKIFADNLILNFLLVSLLYSTHFFERIKTIRMLTSSLLPLYLILHHFATNIEEMKADEERRFFDIATVLEDRKKEYLSSVQKMRLMLSNCSANLLQRANL